MKLRFLFCGFFCLVIRFSSVFGVDNSGIDTTVQSLAKEFQSLRNRLSVLESAVEKQAQIIQAQKDSIVKLEAIVKSGTFNEEEVEKPNYSPRDSENGANQSRDSNNKTHTLQQDRRGLSASFISRKAPHKRKPTRAVRHASVQPIAFYAYMSSHLQNPGGYHTLIFDVTKTNEGNGYNAHLGVFMVPKSGTYFFSWTMGLWYSSYHSTELVVNNQAQGAIYRHTNGDERDSVTGNLILNVKERDVVFIRTRKDYNLGQILSDGYSRTSFSGFLID